MIDEPFFTAQKLYQLHKSILILEKARFQLFLPNKDKQFTTQVYQYISMNTSSSSGYGSSFTFYNNLHTLWSQIKIFFMLYTQNNIANKHQTSEKPLIPDVSLVSHLQLVICEIWGSFIKICTFVTFPLVCLFCQFLTVNDGFKALS